MTLYRATFGGTLGGVEQFSFSWGFFDSVTTSAAARLASLQTWLNTHLDTVSGGETLTVSYSPTTIHSSIRCQRYAAGTGLVDDSADLGVNRPGTGSSTSANLPYSTSCVVSLKGSGAPNPQFGKRGRFYLPPMLTTKMAGGAGNIGTFAADVNARIADSCKAAWDAFTTGDIVLAVIKTPPGGFGYQAVDTFSVGNVPDVQRSRRNRLLESRQVRTIV